MLLCGACSGLVCEFGLYEEFRPKVVAALACVQQTEKPDPALELRLRTTLCHINSMSSAPVTEPDGFIRTTLALAEQSGSRDEQFSALFAMAARSLRCGDYKTGLECAERVCTLSDGAHDPARVLLGQRFLAHCELHLGNLAAATRHAQTVIQFPAKQAFRHYVGIVPQRVSMGAVLARVAWLEGRSDDAAREAAAARAQVDETCTPTAAMFVLGYASIPIALWRGEDEQARVLTVELCDHAARVTHMHWGALAEAYLRVLDWRRSGILSMPIPTNAMETELLATFCPAMLSESSLRRVASGDVGWCAPELMRLDAERRLSVESSDPTAEVLLNDALALARAQGAHAWALRVASSIARMMSMRRDVHGAQELLSGVVQLISQGRDTQDVAQAFSLLAQLDPKKMAQTKVGCTDVQPDCEYQS